jgi:glycosyltransferase involved in cell wall biosynthesis
LVITGAGVASKDLRSRIASDRVEMLGLVDDRRLEDELQQADLALLSQLHEGPAFNMPSKLMNFMTYGLPLIAAVDPEGEVARIVDEAGGGWVVDSAEPGRLPEKVVELLGKPQEIADKGAAAAAYAERHFKQSGYAERFEAIIREAIARAGGRTGYSAPGS